MGQKSTANAGVDLASLIARKVRTARTGRGWTLDELAARSGVSRRMVVNIEQSATNPTVATLLRVSDALGIGLPSLVAFDDAPQCQVTRAGDAPVLWHGVHGGRGVLVAGTQPPEVVELWDWTLEPGDSHDSEAHSAGTRELILVLNGQVWLRVGDERSLLDPGDSARFAGDVPHGYSTATATATAAGGTARFALTVFQPGVGQRATITDRPSSTEGDL